MNEIPVLQTARLTMRGHRLEDLDDVVSMWADPIVTKFIGGRPRSREESWSKIACKIGHWTLLGFGYWAVVETASNRYVGEVGLMNAMRDVGALADSHEAGWALAPWAHGQGYATEAVNAAVAWHDVKFSGARTTCMIECGNDASVRIAEKCGYVQFELTNYEDAQVAIFERLVSQAAI